MDALPTETPRKPDAEAAPEMIGEAQVVDKADVPEGVAETSDGGDVERTNGVDRDGSETGPEVPPLNDVFQDVIWIG
jgi:hypothetical protein